MSDSFSSSDHRHHHLMDKENLFHSPHINHDQDTTLLTHHFPRSLSLQQPLFYYKVSQETTNLGWSGHSPEPSDEDAWKLIYAMKMRGVMGGLWQKHFCPGRCVTSAAAWGPSQVRNKGFIQKQLNGYKGVVVVCGGGGGCDGGATVVKRECAGTGVFLPRSYCTNTTESGKRQACLPTNLPARMIQYSNAPPQIQSTHYEMLINRRKAMISDAMQLPRRRSYIHGGFIDNPEMLLPQEWTY